MIGIEICSSFVFDISVIFIIRKWHYLQCGNGIWFYMFKIGGNQQSKYAELVKNMYIIVKDYLACLPSNLLMKSQFPQLDSS